MAIALKNLLAKFCWWLWGVTRLGDRLNKSSMLVQMALDCVDHSHDGQKYRSMPIHLTSTRKVVLRLTNDRVNHLRFKEPSATTAGIY